MGFSIVEFFNITCSGKVWDKTNVLSNECFQNTILKWIPCGWLWLSLIGYIPYLWRQKSQSGLLTLTVIKMTLTALLTIIYFAHILQQFFNEETLKPDLFSANLLMCSTLILSMCLQFFEWKKRLVTSGVNFIFAFLAFFTMGIYFFKRKEMSLQRNVLDILNLILKFLLVVAFSFADKNATKAKDLTVVEKSSFLSRITFFWMTRIMINGCRQKLSENKVPCLLASEKADYLHEKSKLTHQKLSSVKETPTIDNSVPLIKILIRMFWKEILFTFTLRACYDILIFLNPVLLNIFMTYLNTDPKERDIAVGCVYSLMFFTINVLLVILDQAIFSRGWKTGSKVSTTLMTIIYDKVLKIGMQSSDNVNLRNLLSTDVSMFREMIPYLFILWSGPFQTVICFVILFYYIRQAAAFCFVIVLMIFIFFLISKKIEVMQNEYHEVKGSRFQLLEEMIEFIKSVKLYAQENAYIKKLKKIRDKEINHLKKRIYYETVISTLGEITPLWITLLIFFTLESLNDKSYITTELIFVTQMALSILESNMSMYSDCIFDIIKAKESYKNIVTFLTLEDSTFKPDEKISDEKISVARCSLDLLGDKTPQKTDAIYSVIIDDATFKDGCLKNINLKIKAGQLVAVCGNQNSGKSALLYALLGRIKKESGIVCRVGKVAFTPQEPWVINDTIKNNVLFGKNFHQRHFQQTLKYCCLDEDTNKDIKEEKVINAQGSNLSGGQLYRINLARAVYSRPNIFLLDNPLCAIDITTARKIYNNLLGENGLLKNITRIIVTQPTAHWLRMADQIIVMDGNTVAESGTLTELKARNEKFVELLKQCPQSKELKQLEKENKRSFLMLRTNELKFRDVKSSEVGLKFWKHISNKFKNKSLSQNIRGNPSERFNRQISRQRYMNQKSLKIAQLKYEGLSTQNSDYKVAQRVFRKYLKTIGIWSLLLTILMGMLFEGSKTASNYLFENWSKQINSNSTEEKNNHLIYSGSFSIVAGLFLFLFGLFSTLFMANASCRIHHIMAENVFNMPLQFFEGTDPEVIMLPFTDNLYDVDYELPNAYKMWVNDILRIMTTALLLILHIPIFAIVLLLLIIFIIILSFVFVLATSLLQNFNFKFQSLLYGHFLKTESGTHIINAYNTEEIFVEKAYKYIDSFQQFFGSVIVAKRWSGFLLQFTGCFIILITCLYFVHMNDNSRVGLILTYLILTVKCFDWVVRTSSDIAIKRVSLHRIQKYRDHVQIITGNILSDWPSEGKIEFLNYSAKYSGSSVNCLNEINLCILPGKKIGIVGKSGSGKSSLVMALTCFLTGVNGQINIDDVDIKSLNSKYLRSRLNILPQNTHLFSASLRSNLDPEENFSDEALVRVLADVHLDDRDLDKNCETFSVGDKQLVGLAKCILNKTKVLILDECTANICATLEDQIQRIIEEKFSDCTVLCIAHKLAMIEKYDKILVMDEGEVKEFDTPKILLKRKHGFYMKLKQESKEN